MKNYNFATATRLDLEIWDTQEKINISNCQQEKHKNATLGQQ